MRKQNGHIMRRMQRIVLLITFVAVVPVLAGCANFDPDSLDVFGLNEKKKLAGDRKAIFPEGVPGVTQGIPPQYRMGANQPPPDAALVAPVEPAPAAAPPAKKTATFTQDAKPKAKRAPKPRPATAQQQQAPAGQQQAPAPWPDQAPPQQSSGGSPWPSAPPAGTFSR